MRILVLYSCLILLLTSCGRQAYVFTSFHEPANEGLRMLYSYDGRRWSDLDTVLLRPSVGVQQVMRDPSMVQGPDGTFHLVWTSSWRQDKGFGYASSKDLVHWSTPRWIPAMQSEAAVNVWAPELFYDEATARYLIVWASCIPGRFEKGQEDDSNNHRLYYTATSDFQSFTPPTLFLDPGFSVIDAVIVPRAVNDYVLVLKDNTRPERNLKVAFGETATGPWKQVSAPFTAQFTEGPSVVRLQDHWLIYFDAYQTKTYEAVQTKDFIHFEKSAVQVPADHKHGTIVPVKRKVIKSLLKHFEKT
ncbi:glycoside hydrolase family 43 protein [Chitinophaga horti]|uniref:Glycoside hydrolase family 43 protein n=1 Tax=Chitinophaga horti TaxID=2920382 RepID=A0ABY6J7T4_9BACT|nr:glycoside hydrolase family 43 protein [Chitinophaga horti]UYQ95545.1 glycoside hydrolase family 43 protein [Chitinophaga horti]